jgi:ArsR family metal-binding transcriptional regulator
MSDNDILEMLEQLLPPTNISEKKNILDDLRSFNTNNFELALTKIKKILTPREVAEILK